MAGASPFVRAANQAMQQPGNRKKVREMHQNKASLLKIIRELDLEGQMPPDVKAIIQDLPESTVEDIRAAIIDMLDHDKSVMPIDCAMADAELGNGADVNVVQAAHVIRVRPA